MADKFNLEGVSVDTDNVIHSSGGTRVIAYKNFVGFPLNISSDFGGITIDGEDEDVVFISEGIRMIQLPTSDPLKTGALWNDNGTLKISSGS